VLQLLRCLNTRMHSTLHELHLQTGLPKSTLSRLLDTLRADGYVRAVAERGSYQITPKVRELSDGFSERLNVVNVAIPCLIRTTKQIRWPLAIATLDGSQMVIRFSTMPYSPLAVRPTTYGRRHSLKTSAVGLAYLAHCPQAEQQALFPDGIDAEAQARLADVRRDGYALRTPPARGAGRRRKRREKEPGAGKGQDNGRGDERDGDEDGRDGHERDDSATCAVPVADGDEVLAVLSLTAFARSVNTAFVNQMVPILNETAAEVLEGYRQMTLQR